MAQRKRRTGKPPSAAQLRARENNYRKFRHKGYIANLEAYRNDLIGAGLLTPISDHRLSVVIAELKIAFFLVEERINQPKEQTDGRNKCS
jgi:hypothetical protein